MKKIYQIIMLCAMSFALVGCAKNYQKEIEAACGNNDFEKAYQLLAEAKEDLKIYEVVDLETFVFDKEVQFLISQDNDECSNRLAYLFKEQEVSKKQIYKYLDLGLKNENGILIQTLTNEFLKIIELDGNRSTFEEEERYVKLILQKCSEQDMQEPVIALYNKLQNRGGKMGFTGDSGLYYNTEMTLDVLSALMSFNNEKTNNIIKNLIIQNHSNIGNAHTDYRNDRDCWLTDDHHKRYSIVCSNIMAAAISKRNKTIAEFVCSQAEPLCEKKFKSYDVYTHCYILHYNNVKELKQMYENANFD